MFPSLRPGTFDFSSYAAPIFKLGILGAPPRARPGKFGFLISTVASYPLL